MSGIAPSDGEAVAEAERYLAHPVVRARRRYQEIAACAHKRFTDAAMERCPECGAPLHLTDLVRRHERESELRSY